MKKTLFVFLASLVAVVMSCTPKTVVVNNDPLIDSLLAACATAWNSGNPETTVSIYADDAVIIFMGAGLSGKDSILSFCKGTVPYVKNMNTYRGPYAIHNGLITGTGMYTFDWVGKDQKISNVRGSSTMYWQQDAARKWKVILQISQQADVVKK
jgi:hypothetical protein